MTPYIYFDIETIPTQDPLAHERLAKNIKAPANYKDPDKIAAYIEEAAKDVVAKTSFDGFEGHVCAIAMSNDGGEWRRCITGLHGEKAMIEEFFGLFDEYHSETLVGHNIAGFDIPFLTRRSLVLGCRLPRNWPRDVKPWSDKINDTMTMLGGRDFIGLDSMCHALSIPGKDGFDGSQVAGAWLAGEYNRIAEYCLDDVLRTKAVHERFLAIGW